MALGSPATSQEFDPMLFRNLTFLRVSPAVAKTIKDVEPTLAEHKLHPVGAMELESHGFVSPYGDGDGEERALVQVSLPYVLLCVGGEHKLLPGGVINAAVRKKVAKIQNEEARKVGGKERKRIKEDVVTDLLPRAFVSSSAQSFYVDTKAGWVVIDAAGGKSAENAITKLREAIGSFPAVPLAPEESPRTLMTDWVANGNLPENLTIGDECELKDPGDAKSASIRAKNQDLGADEIKEHLRAGKQVVQLGLTFKDRLTFTLDENLVIRKFKLLDVAMDSLSQTEDSASELDATFALMALEVTDLAEYLAATFNLPAPTDEAA
jgi:recombination associated protein RdgC